MAILGNRGHITACRSPKRPPTRKPKVSRGYYDLIESSSSEPKKGGFMGVALENLISGPFLGQKRALAAPQELAQQHEQHKKVVF